MSEINENQLNEAAEEEYFDVGYLQLCLAVKDIGKSMAFYEKLGFEPVFGDPKDGAVVMESESAVIALYQDMLKSNVITFRGSDVQVVAETLKERGIKLESDLESEPDGSFSCRVVDPDGNIIIFNTHPDELDESGCDCDDDCDCDDKSCDCGSKHEHTH